MRIMVTLCDRPITDVLVKGRGVQNIEAHVHDAVDGPITDVLVKGRGAVNM